MFIGLIFDGVLRICPDFTVRHLAGFSGKLDDERHRCAGVRDDWFLLESCDTAGWIVASCRRSVTEAQCQHCDIVSDELLLITVDKAGLFTEGLTEWKVSHIYWSLAAVTPREKQGLNTETHFWCLLLVHSVEKINGYQQLYRHGRLCKWILDHIVLLFFFFWMHRRTFTSH